MTIGIGYRMMVRSLILIGVLLLALISESAFGDDTLNAGDSKTGVNGTITIGGSAPNFTINSGTITLNGDAAIVSHGGMGNDIKLGNYTASTNGAAIFTGGHTITGIALNSADLDLADSGILTIYGGTDTTSNGEVNIKGEILTATAGFKILGVAGNNVSVTATAGGINMGTNGVDTRNSGSGGGNVELKITDSGSNEDINVGNVRSSSKKIAYSPSYTGNGGEVKISTIGGGAITANSINSYSYSSVSEDSSSRSTSGFGGDVSVSAGGGTIAVSSIKSYAYSKSLADFDTSYASSGNGGAVRVSNTGIGAINVGHIDSSSFSFSESRIPQVGNSDSYSSSGNGGEVKVSTTGSGAISISSIKSFSASSVSSSNCSSGSSSNGGAVSVSTGGSTINITGNVDSYSYSTSTTSATRTADSASSSGNGGAVNISAGGGTINITGNIDSSSSSDSFSNSSMYSDSGSSSSSGNGGSVSVSTTGSGAINLGNIKSSSSSESSVSSYSSSSSTDGGGVSVSTDSGAITVGDIDSSSYSSPPSSSYPSFYSSSGKGGTVCVSTGSGAITVGNIIAYSAFDKGGAVRVLAANGSLVANSTGYALGNIDTNDTVTINTGELAGNIGNIGATGTSVKATDEVNITIGSVTGNRSIDSITTNNANVNIAARIAGSALSLGAINAGTGSIYFNATVGKGGTFSTVSAINLSGGKGTLTLDFDNAANSNFNPRINGQFQSSGTTEVSSIYGINGIVGETYAYVFEDAVLDENGVSYADGTELNNSKDSYRKYTLTNNGLNVCVQNNNNMKTTILALGGSGQVADAANNLISNQRKFDSEGQEFVNQLAALSGSNLLRGSRELIGEKATEATMQAGLKSISAASGAVRNKMTTFRMGNLASGLASSFSSAGSTAAISDMADVDELADAYSTADSGYTIGNTVYHQLTVWANAFGGFGEQGTKGDTTGYDFWNAGTMVGLDYAFAKELRIGGLFGYSYNKTNLYEDRGDSIDNALRLGGYASYNWDNFYVDFSSTMGMHIIESSRNLIANGKIAKGERTGLDFNIDGSIGYTFNLPYDIDFTPSYSLGYTLFYDPEYTETGGGVGNLSYTSFSSNSLLQDTGAKFGKLFRVSEKLAFLPEVWGGLEVEYLNTGGNRNSTTSTSIGGSTYSTAMSSSETYRGYWGAGITALIKDNVSVFGRYDHKVWHKGYNVGFSAGIKVGF